jgi:putative ABC transport system permease protein
LQEEPAYKSVYINYKDEKDIHEAAAELMSLSGVTSVSVNQDGKERLDNMMGSMNYVVLLVIASAAALAFIVLYNLTNINITERIREIATIKVLGFYRKETSSYVFRENMVLTGIGAFFGLFLGYLLHGFVMGRIDVDMVSFDEHIRPVSYLYSIVLTFVFNFLVNRVMSVRLDRINMAESLKSVD